MKLPQPAHLSDDDPKRLIPLRLAKYFKPLFDKLCSQKLLAKCVLGATQNQNESFNNIVWERCPKTTFCSFKTVQISVNLAVLSYNRGAFSFIPLAEHMKVQPGSSLVNYFSVRDHRCIGNAEKRNKSVEKKRLLALKRYRTAAERRGELLMILLMHQGCSWKMTSEY